MQNLRLQIKLTRLKSILTSPMQVVCMLKLGKHCSSLSNYHQKQFHN